MTFRKRAAWVTAALALSTCLTVLLWVLHTGDGIAAPVALLALGVGAPLLVAGYVGYVSRRVAGVVLSAAGAVLLLVGVGLPQQVLRPCLGCLCTPPEQYVYWQHVRAEIAFSSPLGLGPAIRVTAEPADCLCGCPWYYLPLAPLLGGYGLLLLALRIRSPREA